MKVDIGPAIGEGLDPGVSRSALESLDDRVRDAHERIERGIADREHGYAALALPADTEPDRIRAAVDRLPPVDAVLTVGIGGSALGAKTIADALDPGVETVVLDNVDPAWVRAHLSSLSLERTAVHVVSRSGTTAETLANFLVVRRAMENAGVDWTERTLVTTGEDGPLRSLARRHDLPTLAVPTGVPGRYSALSTMGLVPLAIGGGDLEALLEGGRAGRDTLEPSLFECPAYAYGTIAHALADDGALANVMMPYAEALETFAEWFAQLWAESLGKDGLGQFPVRALGVTDQHSQLQLYRAGPPSAMVTFVDVAERPSVPIPEPGNEALAYLEGETLGSLLAAEARATAASLHAAGRPTVTIELQRLDARSLGELLYHLEAATVLAGELSGVNPFDQPAVEWAKRATRGLLGAPEEGEIAAAVEDRPSLIVE